MFESLRSSQTLRLQGKVGHFVSHGTTKVRAASFITKPDQVLLLVHIHVRVRNTHVKIQKNKGF